MNKRMNLPNMQKILMEFERQNERMDMTSEMMGDAIDDAMEVGGGGWVGGGGQADRDGLGAGRQTDREKRVLAASSELESCSGSWV